MPSFVINPWIIWWKVYIFSFSERTLFCSRIKNCFQSQLEHQLLISNRSFLILIKVVAKHLQVFFIWNVKIWMTCIYFSSTLYYSLCRQSLWSCANQKTKKKTKLPEDTQQMLYVHKRLKEIKRYQLHSIRNKIKKGRTRSSQYPSSKIWRKKCPSKMSAVSWIWNSITIVNWFQDLIKERPSFISVMHLPSIGSINLWYPHRRN